MAAVLDLDKLGHPRVLPLLLVGGVRDGIRYRVVLLSRDDQERPPLGVVVVHLRLGPGVQVGGGGLEERRAGGRHGEGLVELVGLLLAHGIREAEAELLVGERDRPVAVSRVLEHRKRRLQRRQGQGKHTAERRRVDGDGDRGQSPAGQDLGQQPAEGVADDGRLPRKRPDDLIEVVRDLSNGLVREDFRVRVRLADGLGIVGPARRERGVARLLSHRCPAVPAARQEPEAVHEDDGLPSGGVGPLDLLHFVLGDRRRLGRPGLGGSGGHSVLAGVT